MTQKHPVKSDANQALLRYDPFVPSDVFSSLYIDNALVQARAEAYLAAELSVNVAIPARLGALAVTGFRAFIPAPTPNRAVLTKQDYFAGMWRGRYPVYALWKLPPFAFVLFTGTPEHLQDALYQTEPSVIRGISPRDLQKSDEI